MKKHFLLIYILSFYTFSQTFSNSFFIGDPLPDAPVLSSRGKYKVGVKTIQVHNPKQIDIINSNKDKTVLYDRTLTLEIWYPALLEKNIKEEGLYNQMMGNI